MKFVRLYCFFSLVFLFVWLLWNITKLPVENVIISTEFWPISPKQWLIKLRICLFFFFSLKFVYPRIKQLRVGTGNGNSYKFERNISIELDQMFLSHIQWSQTDLFSPYFTWNLDSRKNRWVFIEISTIDSLFKHPIPSMGSSFFDSIE